MLQLKKFPDISVSTLEEARGSRPFPEEHHFRHEARDEASFPCFSGNYSRSIPCHLKRGALDRKGERNSRVVPAFPESPRCLSPFQRNLFTLHCLDFPAEDRSHHGDTWDSPWKSLVGKPRGKATDSMIDAIGNVTLLLQLGRKAHVHAPSRDED